MGAPPQGRRGEQSDRGLARGRQSRNLLKGLPPFSRRAQLSPINLPRQATVARTCHGWRIHRTLCDGCVDRPIRGPYPWTGRRGDPGIRRGALQGGSICSPWNTTKAARLKRLRKNRQSCHPEEAKPVLSETKEGPLYLLENSNTGVLRFAQDDSIGAFFRSL